MRQEDYRRRRASDQVNCFRQIGLLAFDVPSISYQVSTVQVG